jgi:hypothetical protein
MWQHICKDMENNTYYTWPSPSVLHGPLQTADLAPIPCLHCTILRSHRWGLGATFTLDVCVRQARDPIFAAFCSAARTAVTQADINNVLQPCFCTREDALEFLTNDTVVLCTHKAQVRPCFTAKPAPMAWGKDNAMRAISLGRFSTALPQLFFVNCVHIAPCPTHPLSLFLLKITSLQFLSRSTP